MLWFQMGYDRVTVARQVIDDASTEQVCDGYKRTSWLTSPHNGKIFLHFYQQRQEYDRSLGESVILAKPFYRAQVYGDMLASNAVGTIVDIHDTGVVELVRSPEDICNTASELRREQLKSKALAFFDEALLARAYELGIVLAVPIVEDITISYDLVA